MDLWVLIDAFGSCQINFHGDPHHSWLSTLLKLLNFLFLEAIECKQSAIHFFNLAQQFKKFFKVKLEF